MKKSVQTCLFCDIIRTYNQTRNYHIMAKKKRQQAKSRNWLAVRAHLRGGAGTHKNKKKEMNRRACRGKHRE